MRLKVILPLFCLILAVSADVSAALPVPGSAREDFERMRARIAGESGKRHLEIGRWCNDAGLLDLAKEQFQLTGELSTGGYRSAAYKYLSALNGLSPASIKKNYHRPTRRELKLYRKKKEKAFLLDRRGSLKLADFAYSNRSVLMDEALTIYRTLVEESGTVLEFDRKGRIVLDTGTIPEAVSRTFRDSDLAVTVNYHVCLRDGFLKKIPEVKEVYMKEGEGLRVFSTNSPEEAAAVLQLGEALLPILEKDLDGAPTRAFTLFLFQQRGGYEHFCDSSGHSVNKAVDGFSSLRDMAAVISMEETDGQTLTPLRLHCMVLHELVHLFHHAISNAVMPGWYEEGLAETYGGVGTFEWDGRKLKKVKKPMADHRITALRNSPHLLDIEKLIATEVRHLLAGEREAVRTFYSQSWAFLRFLRNGAGSRAARKLKDWEEECRAGSLDAEAARVLFRIKFAEHLPGLKKGFSEYLKKL